MEMMDGTASHIEALVFAMCRLVRLGMGEQCHIMELGCGFYSTPLLQRFAVENRLGHVVHYQEEPWKNSVAAVYQGLCFEKVEDWNRLEAPADTALIFVDHESRDAQGVQDDNLRMPNLGKESFRSAGMVIVHDWQGLSSWWPKVLLNYRDCRVFDAVTPTTAVLSNVYDLR